MGEGASLPYLYLDWFTLPGLWKHARVIGATAGRF